MQHVYRQPPQYRPQLYSPRRIEPYTLRWLFNRATQQYILLVEPGGGWDVESVPYGATPAVVTGDIMVGPLLSSGGYPVTLYVDGILSVDTGGDTSRQSMLIDVYDSSLSAFYGAVLEYLGNQAPIFSPNSLHVDLLVGVAMESIAIKALATDAENDTLTWSDSITGTGTGADKRPAGTSVDSSGNWTGTPTTEGSGSFTGTVTDVAGDTANIAVTWTTTDVAIVPDVVGLNIATATGTIEAARLVVADPVIEVPSTEPIGTVIAQDPAATTEVDPFSEVELTISAGTIGTITQILIDEDGNPRADLTGITVVIWLADSASGTPDVELQDQTTDGSGEANWEFPAGDLNDGDAVFFVAFNGSPPSNFTAGRIVPSYDDGEP